jgi:DNA-binding NtrC family response regulator
MNVDLAALIEATHPKPVGNSTQLPEPVRLKLAEPPVRDRVQRLVKLADALLAEAEALARDKAFTDEATKLKQVDIQSGIDFYDEVQRFETHLIMMALAETGGNQARASKLLGIKPTTLNSKIKLFGISQEDISR